MSPTNTPLRTGGPYQQYLGGKFERCLGHVTHVNNAVPVLHRPALHSSRAMQQENDSLFTRLSAQDNQEGNNLYGCGGRYPAALQHPQHCHLMELQPYKFIH